jgi:hypothetical protein
MAVMTRINATFVSRNANGVHLGAGGKKIGTKRLYTAV